MKKEKKDKDKEVLVMIGGGDQSIFVKAKKGEKVYIGDGLRIEAGLTLEEEKKRWDKKLEQVAKQIEKEERKERVKQKIKSMFRK